MSLKTEELVSFDQVKELARDMWRGEPVPGRVYRFAGALLGLVDNALESRSSSLILEREEAGGETSDSSHLAVPTNGSESHAEAATFVSAGQALVTDADIDAIFHANHSRNDHPWVNWRRFARAVVAHAIAGKVVVDHDRCAQCGIVNAPDAQRCYVCDSVLRELDQSEIPSVEEMRVLLRGQQDSLKTADLPDGESMLDEAMALADQYVIEASGDTAAARHQNATARRALRELLRRTQTYVCGNRELAGAGELCGEIAEALAATKSADHTCCHQTMLKGHRCEGCPLALPTDTLIPRRESQ